MNEAPVVDLGTTLPRISVVMPVFNASLFLRQAVDSVLSQTFGDFELIAIDDGSRDDSLQILGSYRDSRIRIVSNETNRGLIYTLNRGLSLARAKIVARMDADDVCRPERFARQTAFLDAHPEVALVGTWVQLIDDEGRRSWKGEPYPADDSIIHSFLLRECCFYHPTVMFRRDAVLGVGGYADFPRHAEDYDLWLRLSDRHVLANLPEQLLDYRIHRNQVSVTKIKEQNEAALMCRRRAIARRQSLGEVAATPQSFLRPSWWEKLRGVPGTLGADYLNWARLYAGMGRWALARALSWKAVQFSSLSPGAWWSAVWTTIAATLGACWIRRISWYHHRLANGFRRKAEKERA
jgi:glycosyltransferase involved in cell wall biosynthesis